MIDFKLAHLKSKNFEIIDAIIPEDNTISKDVEVEDLYYIDNIYVAAYLKCREFSLVAIQKCKDKRSDKVFNHFWFVNKNEIKPVVISYYNDTLRDNVNVNKFVAHLQSIKKILNVGKVI